MKFILIAFAIFCFSILSIMAFAQSNNSLPFFARYLQPAKFDYEEAYIKIDNKEASYNDLLQLQDSTLLKVEIYTKKEGIKVFGKDLGKHGVVLFTTKKYKAPLSVVTSEDSLDYYQQQGIKAYIKPDKYPTLDGDTTYTSWVHFLQKNLRADVPTEKGAPMGVYRVNVRFVVNENGSVSDISVDEDAGYGTKSEVIRMMSHSPVWQPGVYKGKPIKFNQQELVNFAVVEM